MDNIIINLLKGFLGEEIKKVSTEVLKKAVNFIHVELKKGAAGENVSIATAQNFNIAYQLAFTLVTMIKKIFKI